MTPTLTLGILKKDNPGFIYLHGEYFKESGSSESLINGYEHLNKSIFKIEG